MLLGVGAFSSCNYAVGGNNRENRHFPKLIRRRPSGNAVTFNRRTAKLPRVTLVATGDRKSEPSYEPSQANRLRLGGLSYKEKFMVRCYEVGMNKTASIETIANLLQEVSCNHAQSVGLSTDGFSTTPTMRDFHLIWVTTRMHIEIYKYPAWADVVEIETWAQIESRFTGRRDWLLKYYATGEVIGRCTSKWVMMNQDTRRLEKFTDDIHDEYQKYCPKATRLVFPEENNASLKKISKLEEPSQYSKLGLVPRRADLDMNMHVNNVTYVAWVMESMPRDIIMSHELHSITLDFRRECQHEDVIDSLASRDESVVDDTFLKVSGTNGSHAAGKDKNDYLQFLHLLRFSKDGSEINRGRTVWRRKPAKR